MGTEPFCIRSVDAHAAGGAVRLLVDGVASLSGQTLEQKRRALERRLSFARTGLLREPRGDAELVGAVFTEPVSPGAAAGLLSFNADRFVPLSGSAIIAAATIGLERHILVPRTLEAFTLDTLAGPVEVRPTVLRQAETGAVARVSSVAYRPPPSAAVRAAFPISVDGRHVPVDIAWASGWFAVVDREALGVPPESASVHRVRELVRALSESLSARVAEWTVPFAPALPPGMTGIEGVVLTGPASSPHADLRTVTVQADGSIDRSPSGGATAAVLAILDAMGLVDDTRPVVQEGPTGLCFSARVVDRVQVQGGEAGVRAEIAGQAWITGEHTFYFAADDPSREGFTP